MPTNAPGPCAPAEYQATTEVTSSPQQAAYQ